MILIGTGALLQQPMRSSVGIFGRDVLVINVTDGNHKMTDAPKRTASQIGRSNSRNGKTHERRVAAYFSEWSGIEFRRRRVEGRDNATLWIDSAADVIPVGANFLFSIEAKKGAGFSVDALMANPLKCLFKQWWFQTCYDAKLISDLKQRMVLPMLCFKPAPQLDWIAFSTRAIPHLKPKAEVTASGDGLWFTHLLFNSYSRLGETISDVSHSAKNAKLVTMAMDDVVLCRWKDFAANVDPNPLLVRHEP